MGLCFSLGYRKPQEYIIPTLTTQSKVIYNLIFISLTQIAEFTGKLGKFNSMAFLGDRIHGPFTWQNMGGRGNHNESGSRKISKMLTYS